MSSINRIIHTPLIRSFEMAGFSILLFIGCILLVGVSCDEAKPAPAPAPPIMKEVVEVVEVVETGEIRKPIPRPLPPIPVCCPLDCGTPPINPCPPRSTWTAGHEILNGCRRFGIPPPLGCQTCGCFCDPGYSMVGGACVSTEVCCPQDLYP